MESESGCEFEMGLSDLRRLINTYPGIDLNSSEIAKL